MTRRRQRGTASYALHRVNLARARAEAASTAYYAWLDKAERAKSRPWRTRYMAEAARMRARYERAERDHALWMDRYNAAADEERAEEEARLEREQRRAERAGSSEEAGELAQEAIERELELTEMLQRTKSRRGRELLRQRIEQARADADRWMEEEARRREEEERKRKRVVYEYVLKVSYKSRPRRGKGRPKHSHVWWDVRLRKIDGSRATEREQEAAVRAIRRGEMLDGWQALGIAWDRGARESFDDEPSRWASSASELRDALASLSPTLGRDKGTDWIIGEEPIDERDA